MVHERVITTLPKAKELRPFAERAITLGKRALQSEDPGAALHARRLAASYFHSGNADRIPDGGYKRPHAPRTSGVLALDKLFDDIASRFVDRPGGYTRILKLGARRGDGAEMALIELLGSESKPAHAEDKPEKKKGRRFFSRRKKEDGSRAAASEAKPAKKGAKPAASSKAGSKSGGKTASSKGEAKSKTQRKKKEKSE